MFYPADIGIDLGTTNIRVLLKGKGVVIREPAVIAYDREAGKICACGEEAGQMIGRTSGNINAVYPLKDGVISDYVMTEYLLRYFILKAIGHRGLLKPRIVISVPSRITDVERRAVEEAAYQAGAKDVIIVEAAISSAIGAGLDISKPAGNLIVDIGGGITEIAVISLGGVVSSAAIATSGKTFNESIIRYVRKNHLLFIGAQTAESVKKKIGTAAEHSSERTMEINGRNVFTGLPGRIILTSGELVAPLAETASKIAETVANMIADSTSEMAVDISKRGIILSGGGAKLRGLEKIIRNRTGIMTVTAEDPDLTAVRGTAKYLKMLD